ncbi:acetyltransferase [Micromonospora sp. LHW51205]|uniref:arylamine N-acetyltransferase family protein n=1 Tax=Micromonospora sp. LHW51205 TaxID=2248752 RepID=UPI000DE8CFD6|nr:arylamine N-acetyltransferase [Micromonospora sp. LHW51205]RBQ09698.1 acetyltransferase [Micromonospora sp. LHW51205]
MLTDEQVRGYLDRIDAARPERPDLAALRDLQERHTFTVPFENLDYHLGHEIYMDERVLDKVIRQRRGGGCFEINTSLFFLLRALGFAVTLHQGRVWLSGRFNGPHNHLMLTVDLPETGSRWLVDVGFGKNSRFPFRLDAAEPYVDPHGRFATRRVEPGVVDVYRNDALQYRFHDEPADLADFRQNLWWYRTCPDSPFLRNMFCTLPTADGRVTLQGDVLTVIAGDRRSVETLTDDDALLEAYRRWFGIVLDKPPTPSPYADQSSRMAFFQNDDGGPARR